MTVTLGELSALELDELGIDPPRTYLEAHRNDETTITFVMLDEYGGDHRDCPRDDHSGEDAWEWIEWDSGHERNEWIAENFDCANCNEPPHEGDTCPAWDEPHPCEPPDSFNPVTDFWIERYEHGQVCYAPTGESSQVDRQWDVAPGVAIMRFTKPETFYDGNPTREQLLDFARGICDEYTSWCNGDIYGMIRYELLPPVGYDSIPPLLREEDFIPEWRETDACWGFVGADVAAKIAKTGDW